MSIGKSTLTTLCFDLADDPSGAGSPTKPLHRRDLYPERAHSLRLYKRERLQPTYMAWHEATADPIHLDAPALPVRNVEQMQFTLARDIGRPDVPDNPWLYIVHTDIPDDVVEDYNAWYDEEHLPRLVAVPGVVRARRYVAVHGVPHCLDEPRYLTAYELTDPNAFESPAGLTARKTPWTEKMRSLFFNTRRRMYRLCPSEA